ncbi:MAG: hypothetical protein J7499_07025 [Sphingopyxis sp.]|nr:hypothetical protein [Sphingopyxis sp.]
MSNADEDKKLASILTKPDFVPHTVPWTQAYADYRNVCGDPWQISPAVFQPPIRKAQLKLYISRQGGGPLKRIRYTPGLLCCPMCGSPSRGSLDHYLPREDFPEFAVLPANLLPACSLCNSGAKGRTFKGAISGERFLHPYFDTCAKDKIWRIRIDGHPAAPLFAAVPEPGLAKSLRLMIVFHLDNILGTAFETAIATIWSNLPEALADDIQNVGLNGKQALDRHYRDTVVTQGLNSWRAALLRGVNANDAALDHVAAAAAKVTLPDIKF